MFRWLAGKGASRRRVMRELSLISPRAWRRAVDGLPFLAGLSAQQDEALRARAAWLLASKTFSGAHGFEITDDIRLAVAIQAALPIMELDPSLYEGWVEIVVYPGGFLIPRSEVHEDGVVHEYLLEASGEAWEGGPIILSWEDSEPGGRHAVNVVIHEFAHKLDLYGGAADGMPSLHDHADIRPAIWMRVLDAAFDDFNTALDAVEDAIPRHIDPESEAAAPWYDSLPLDPYAAMDTAEFFAVSSEAFFVDPEPLAQALPDWYGLLRQYYRQDPLERLTGQSLRVAGDFP
ncbi:MAG TPA: M90 family metallopeptidase [Eoetvoesiella sp.]|uniref:M90 family metallopeptidase n=1 Tax=Eoetvoesiella sp. TaxID=1966355 RepID=UPI002B959F0B|nr:M90 family metallopeptidase [Eoetvoesiella sp.]HWK63103.1 M90 family metallopeptidase [Eoetvoesiella sp.]